ncbi:MAG: hypothetical protein D6806_10145, partial [Deltaproteobacteria bacterium]
MADDRRWFRCALDCLACSLAGICVGAAACMAVQHGAPLPAGLWRISAFVGAAWIVMCSAVYFGISRSIRSPRESSGVR